MTALDEYADRGQIMGEEFGREFRKNFTDDIPRSQLAERAQFCLAAVLREAEDHLFRHGATVQKLDVWKSAFLAAFRPFTEGFEDAFRNVEWPKPKVVRMF